MRVVTRMLALLRRRKDGEQVDRDIAFHIDQEAEALIASGMAPAEARRQARAAFGSRESVKEAYRDLQRIPGLESAWRDLRHAIRALRRAPGFSMTATATLALCLGANLAIFAVVDAVLLRPLPFPAANRLVTMFNTYPRAGVPRDESSITNYYERRGRIAAFGSLAMLRGGSSTVGPSGSVEREPVLHVSPEFFATVGVAPAQGRVFTDAEMNASSDAVAIVTHEYWRDRLNGDPSVVGRRLRVDGVERTIIGVLPAGFQWLSLRARLYLPFSTTPESRLPADRHAGSAATIIARLAPGATLEAAQQQVDANNEAVERVSPYPQAQRMTEAGFRTVVVPLRADHVAAVRPMLFWLQAGSLLLLTIGMVNLLNLLVIRISDRLPEFAIRRALGARARQVASQLAAEIAVIVTIGTAAGEALGALGVRLLTTLGTDRLPLGASVAFTPRMAAAGAGLGAVAGFAMMAVAMMITGRAQSGRASRLRSRGTTASRATQHLRHGFIVVQIALSFMLLAGAALLGSSLQRVLALSPGFEADHLLAARVSLPPGGSRTTDAIVSLLQRVTASIHAQPGARSVGLTTKLPLDGDVKSAVTVRGFTPRAGESVRGHYTYGVSGDFFDAMGIRVKDGRAMTGADEAGAARVCVVDEDFASRYWPDGRAVDQVVFAGATRGPDAEGFRVIGVVAPIKQGSLTDEARQGAVYFPFRYYGDASFFVVTRTEREPLPFATTMRRVLHDVDPDLLVSDVRSMEMRVDDSLVSRRSPALLSVLFSGLALLLTAIGTYGVVSYAVSRRRREIGLRMALGAVPGGIRTQFLLMGMRQLALGVGLGVVGFALAASLLRPMLFRESVFDLRVLAGTMVTLTGVCLTACLGPALRASRVIPTEALLAE